VNRQVDPRNKLDVAQRLATSQNVRFLEIGCGMGYTIEEAMRRGWEPYGLDVSPDFVREVNDQLGIGTFLGMVNDANYPEDFFDIIYVDSVLEHIPQPRSTIAETYRILKPNGMIFLEGTSKIGLH